MSLLRTIGLWVFAIIRVFIGLMLMFFALIIFVFPIGFMANEILAPVDIHYARGTVLETHRIANGSHAATIQFKADNGKEYKSATYTRKEIKAQDQVTISYIYPNPQVGAAIESQRDRRIEGVLLIGGFSLAGLIFLILGLSLLSKRIWRIWQVGPAIRIPSWVKPRTQS